ncbi:hypothetical protein DFP72DRAFT_284169 [Ephemerocybe angulata]|uniref:Uncharacterized protein n=1 Tax=Ephemerocybe angulata TaxID=980116 RepID=A0A8H6I1S9_9AGAR|nr:hypothetical protein DFP72DRAFT_284169 [Tulosesus angulatus]
MDPTQNSARLAPSSDLAFNVSQALTQNKRTDAKPQLRRALNEWKTRKYATKPKVPFIAFVLDGWNDIKGEAIQGDDAGLLNRLVPLAKELGFCVFLVDLKKTINGQPHHKHWTYSIIPNPKRPRTYKDKWGPSDGYHWPTGEGWDVRDAYELGDYLVPMGDIISEDQILSDFKSLDGAETSMAGGCRFELDSLIPKDVFVNATPPEDERNFDRDRGVVTYEFNRWAVVLYLKDDEADVFTGLNHPEWALKVLDTPTPMASKVAAAVLKQLEEKTPRHSLPNALCLLERAADWKQGDLWNAALPYIANAPVKTVTAVIAHGLKAFELDLLQSGVSRLVEQSASLSSKVGIAQTLVAHNPSYASRGWVERLVAGILEDYNNPEVADVPGIVWIVQVFGPPAGEATLLPKLQKPRYTYEILVALAKSLHAGRSLSKAPFNELIVQCLNAAAPYWQGYCYVNADSATERVREIIELSLAIGDLRPCELVFDLLFASTDKKVLEKRLREQYRPLVPYLKSLLAQHGQSITAQPFRTLFRNTVAVALSACCPTPSQPQGHGPTVDQLLGRYTACGCEECVQMQAFLLGTAQEIKFTVALARRKHVEAYLRWGGPTLAQLVETQTVKAEKAGKAHTLVVKRKERPSGLSVVPTAVGPAVRVPVGVRAFVESVCGEEGVLREVMGDRYRDVVDVLEGRRVFLLGDLSKDGASAVGSLVGNGSGAMQAAVRLGPSASAAGMKRKRLD